MDGYNSDTDECNEAQITKGVVDQLKGSTKAVVDQVKDSEGQIAQTVVDQLKNITGGGICAVDGKRNDRLTSDCRDKLNCPCPNNLQCRDRGSQTWVCMPQL